MIGRLRRTPFGLPLLFGAELSYFERLLSETRIGRVAGYTSHVVGNNVLIMLHSY